MGDLMWCVHSTGSWRPAPSVERVPSWSIHRVGSFPVFQTSWLTRRAQPHGAWCRGCRWSSWRRCMAREGWNGANEGRRRENREDRHVIVSWVKQRSPQSTECYWQSSDSSVVCLTNSHVLMCAMFLWSRMNVWICMRCGSVCLLTETGLSMERRVCWRPCLGCEPSFDTGAEGRSPRNSENPAVLSQNWHGDFSCEGLGRKSKSDGSISVPL